jgi:hypothetical protein
LTQQAANEVKAVGPAGQRETWFVVTHFRFEGLDVGGVYVGQVGDDEVEVGGYGLQKVATTKGDAPVDTVALGVGAGDSQGGRRYVGGVDEDAGEGVGEGDGYGAAAGADVGDDLTPPPPLLARRGGERTKRRLRKSVGWTGSHSSFESLRMKGT